MGNQHLVQANARDLPPRTSDRAVRDQGSEKHPASSQPNFGSPSPLEPSSEEEEEEEDLFVFNDTMEGPRAGIHFKVYSRVSHRGGHVLLAPTEVGEYKGGRGRHRK